MKDMKIVMIGLNGAGKTTILYKLKQEKTAPATSIPTSEHSIVRPPTHWTAFNVETIEHNDVSFTIWDIWGRYEVRCLWKGWCAGNTDGLIFVVDSSDRDRVGEARHELHKILKEDESRGADLLVFAHKQDLPDAMSAAEVSEKLGLDSVEQRRWCVRSTSAVTSGEGLYEGLDWLSANSSSEASS